MAAVGHCQVHRLLLFFLPYGTTTTAAQHNNQGDVNVWWWDVDATQKMCAFTLVKVDGKNSRKKRLKWYAAILLLARRQSA